MTTKRKKNPVGHAAQTKLRRRIILDPNISAGEPVIRGTRTHVAIILDSLAAGLSSRDILDDYPQLEPDDIRAALAFASDLVRGVTAA